MIFHLIQQVLNVSNIPTDVHLARLTGPDNDLLLPYLSFSFSTIRLSIFQSIPIRVSMQWGNLSELWAEHDDEKWWFL